MTMNERIRGAYHNPLAQQIFGAVATLLGGILVSWFSGFVSLPTKVEELKDEMRKTFSEVRKEIDASKARDDALTSRQNASDAAHLLIMQQHQELLGKLRNAK